jgi:hypothetical protein
MQQVTACWLLFAGCVLSLFVDTEDGVSTFHVNVCEHLQDCLVPYIFTLPYDIFVLEPVNEFLPNNMNLKVCTVFSKA